MQCVEWKITVWDDARIAYVATAKVANTAVKAALLTSYVEDRGWHNPHGESVPYVEASPEDLRGKYADYITFGLARNPYDRFVSFYADKIVGKGWYGSLGKLGFKKGQDFEACALVAAGLSDERTDPHVATQVDRLVDTDGTFLPDLVLRFESIVHDWKALRAIAEARAPRLALAPLAARRTSQRDKSWQSYYTPKAQEAVAAKYAQDFEVLGYSTEIEPKPLPMSKASGDSLDVAAVPAGAVVLDTTGHNSHRAAAVGEAGAWYLPFGPSAGFVSRGPSAATLVPKLAGGPPTVVLVAPHTDLGPVGDNVQVIEVAMPKVSLLSKLLRR